MSLQDRRRRTAFSLGASLRNSASSVKKSGWNREKLNTPDLSPPLTSALVNHVQSRWARRAPPVPVGPVGFAGDVALGVVSGEQVLHQERDQAKA
jgi:hypothetical protein